MFFAAIWEEGEEGVEGNGRKAGMRSAADPKGLVQGGIGWQRWQWEGDAGGGNKKAEFPTRLGSQVGKVCSSGRAGSVGMGEGEASLPQGCLKVPAACTPAGCRCFGGRAARRPWKGSSWEGSVWQSACG